MLEQKQEVLIVLDDSKPPEGPADDTSQTGVTPTQKLSQCLLDLDIEANQVLEGDGQSKAALLDRSLPDAQVPGRKFPSHFQTASLGGGESDRVHIVVRLMVFFEPFGKRQSLFK